jgi:hypothetical protein
MEGIFACLLISSLAIGGHLKAELIQGAALQFRQLEGGEAFTAQLGIQVEAHTLRQENSLSGHMEVEARTSA